VLQDYAGSWTGTLGGDHPGLPLVLHVNPDAAQVITLDSPSQNGFGLVAEGGVRKGRLSATWQALGATYRGQLRADVQRIQGTFKQKAPTFTLDLTRASEADLAPPARPQEPVRPLPYAEEAVRIAVLRYDDRGVGQSSGTFEGATSRDFAADAAAVHAHLAARPDTGRIGFIGHSEGGVVAALAIAENEVPADFVVTLAAPFVPMRDVIAQQAEDGMRLAGLDAAARASNMAVQNRILDAAMVDGDEATVCAAIDRATDGLPESVRSESRLFCGPWFHTLLRLDPAELHRSADAPTLAVFGELDIQVAAEPNAAAAQALPGVDVQVFEGVNHLFQPASTGAVAEYAAIEQTMSEEVIEAIIEWVSSRD